MRRDLVLAGILWIILTILGEILVSVTDIFPFLASEEGELIDGAFNFLMIMAVPVFSFVVAVLLFSLYRYRDGGESGETGEARPSFQRVNGIFIAWTVITTALAIAILIYPGIVGLNELRANTNAELVVQVVAEKWDWTFIYPEHDITIEEADDLVLPVDTSIRFEIASKDILHSFWVPAFRMKADAVPGQVQVLYVTPIRTGTFTQDPNMRVQCAELCGTGHTRMRASVVVMEPAEFEEWIASR